MRRPTYLPDPELLRRPLPTRALKGRKWYRLHPQDRNPIYFSRSNANRFTPPDVGVLYAGAEIETVLFEVFGDEMFAGDHRIRAYRWFRFALSLLTIQTTKICDLRSQKTRASLNVDLSSLTSADVSITQKWALEIHQHPYQPDGILYTSRMTGKACLALFERPRLYDKISAELLGNLNELKQANQFLDQFACRLV